MSFRQSCHYRTSAQSNTRIDQGITTEGNKKKDLTQKLGKLSIPSFDGSSNSTSSAWVHKLDTYFHLKPMTKAKEIKFSTLHLDGESHEWWYHWLITLGHATITSYLDFT